MHSVNPRLFSALSAASTAGAAVALATSNVDQLHILAEISDLLRQFRDVCLQIINASSQLQHDLGHNRSAAT